MKRLHRLREQQPPPTVSSPINVQFLGLEKEREGGFIALLADALLEEEREEHSAHIFRDWTDG